MDFLWCLAQIRFFCCYWIYLFIRRLLDTVYFCLVPRRIAEIFIFVVAAVVDIAMLAVEIIVPLGFSGLLEILALLIVGVKFVLPMGGGFRLRTP